jgi:hypothetical protein
MRTRDKVSWRIAAMRRRRRKGMRRRHHPVALA